MSEYTSERVNSEYLKLNSCGIEQLGDRDHNCIRENGRIDYHILYIAQGACYAELRGKQVVLYEGDILLYPPREKHKYSFLPRINPSPVIFIFQEQVVMSFYQNAAFSPI